MSDERREDHPHTPGTQFCAAMLDAFDRAEKPPEVRAIAIVTHPVAGGSNGVAYSGYEDDAAVAADLITHVRAILRTMGADLHVITAPKTATGERS